MPIFKFLGALVITLEVSKITIFTDFYKFVELLREFLHIVQQQITLGISLINGLSFDFLILLSVVWSLEGMINYNLKLSCFLI